METDSNLSNDSREMISFLWILRAWLLDCSAHGIPRIISSTNFRRKIFWLVSVLISASFLCFQIWTLFLEVSSHPISVNIQIEHQKAIRFPAVTLCNSNKLKFSMVEKLNGDFDLHKTIVFTEMEPILLRKNYEILDMKVNFERTILEPAKNIHPKCAVDRSYLGERELKTVEACGGDEEERERNDEAQVGDEEEIESNYEAQAIDEEEIDSNDGAQVGGFGFNRKKEAYDYSDQISPNNQFECKDGQCISQVTCY